MKALRLRARGLSGRLAHTVTWERLRSRSLPPDDPVQSLMLLPAGPMFPLDMYRWQGRSKQWISVGAHPLRDMVIGAPTVSAMHCLLFRKRENNRLYVGDSQSKNGVFVNNVCVFEGMIELASGHVLCLGGVFLLACGALGEAQRPTLSGATLHEILERATAVYGSRRMAAQALRIKRTTLGRWLASRRFDVPGT